MLELAARHGDPNPVRLKTIADAHDIPERFLVQILLQLKTSGLITSTRGASGGYQLMREPSQISLADIIGIVDFAENDETRPAEPPGLSPAKTAIRELFNVAFAAQQQVMENISLAELMLRANETDAMTYSI